MADLYEPDIGTAFYRSKDPIKKLRIRVRLKRAAVSNIVPQAEIEEEKGGHVELKDLKDRLKTNFSKSDIEEHDITWQEKLFSRNEFTKYLEEQNCVTVVDKKYHEDCKQLEETGGRPNARVFTYVSHDSYMNIDEQMKKYTNDPNETATLMADRMANLRLRRNANARRRGGDASVIPKSHLIEYEPSEELKKQNHYMSSGATTMYIMADLNPKGQDAYSPQNEAVLCTIKVSGDGIVSFTPDFTKGSKAYRAESKSAGRELYEYTLHHTSKQLTRQERDRETKMYRELYSRHAEFLAACVGSEFEMPPMDMLRLLVYGEIESAQRFEYSDLFVQYYVELPEGWYPNGYQPLTGVTHTSCTKTLSRDGIAYFSHPFSFELIYQRDPLMDNNQDYMPQWPQILLEVQSMDWWQRYRVEGYGNICLPMTTGVSTHEVECWRPIGNSVVSEMRRFFTGGSAELEDLTYTSVPSTFEGNRLSKFGFRTVGTGSVKLRLNCIQQSQAFLQSSASRKKVGTIMDKIGFSAAQANIMGVIEAFQRAKQRMVKARETLKEDFIQTLKAHDVDELGDN